MYVFCELCHEQRESGDAAEIFISSCCHVYCRKCCKSSSNCSVCGKPCRKTLINRALPNSVKEYFMNHADQLTKIAKIYRFQIGKMDRFVSANADVVGRYETKKQRAQKLKEMYDSYRNGIKQEQRLIEQLKQKAALQSPAVTKQQPTKAPCDPLKAGIFREDFFRTSTDVCL
uniref:RING-type domain-containing protein n=1 Tax=Anopheles braziliensis TaxID=58242 RepID=A0A2M3ZBU5_9DIPT